MFRGAVGRRRSARRLMRPCVEAGGFELPACSCKRREDLVGNRQLTSGEEAIHVEHPEANAFEMERRNRAHQPLTLLAKRPERLVRRIGSDEGDDRLHVILGSLSMIHGQGVEIEELPSMYEKALDREGGCAP